MKKEEANNFNVLYQSELTLNKCTSYKYFEIHLDKSWLLSEDFTQMFKKPSSSWNLLKVTNHEELKFSTIYEAMIIRTSTYSVRKLFPLLHRHSFRIENAWFFVIKWSFSTISSNCIISPFLNILFLEQYRGQLEQKWKIYLPNYSKTLTCFVGINSWKVVFDLKSWFAQSFFLYSRETFESRCTLYWNWVVLDFITSKIFYSNFISR